MFVAGGVALFTIENSAGSLFLVALGVTLILVALLGERVQPPKASKHPEVRYLDIREDDELGEDQLRSWIEQASKLPGEQM
jgi:hypothetical protein